MVREQIDLMDGVVSPFFVIAGGVEVGILEFAPYGVDFASSVFTLGSGAAAVGISLAKIVSVLAILIAFGTNKPDFDAMKMVETFAAIATIGFILVPPFSPLIEGLIQSSFIAGTIAIIIQSAGFFSLAYLG